MTGDGAVKTLEQRNLESVYAFMRGAVVDVVEDFSEINFS